MKRYDKNVADDEQKKKIKKQKNTRKNTHNDDTKTKPKQQNLNKIT